MMSGRPNTRATQSSLAQSSETVASGSYGAVDAGACTSSQLTRENLKGRLDHMKDEILSEFRCTVATLQSTVSSHVIKIQEVEEGLKDVDGRVTGWSAHMLI